MTSSKNSSTDMVKSGSQSSTSFDVNDRASTDDYAGVAKTLLRVIDDRVQKAKDITDKKIRELEEKVQTVEQELTEKTDEKIAEIDSQQIDQVQTLSIFVAFFTFVSVEFGILRAVPNPMNATGFTLILLGGLVFFVLVVDEVLNTRRSLSSKTTKKVRVKFGILLLVSMFFIAAGTLMLWQYNFYRDYYGQHDSFSSHTQEVRVNLVEVE